VLADSAASIFSANEPFFFII